MLFHHSSKVLLAATIGGVLVHYGAAQTPSATTGSAQTTPATTASTQRSTATSATTASTTSLTSSTTTSLGRSPSSVGTGPFEYNFVAKLTAPYKATPEAPGLVDPTPEQYMALSLPLHGLVAPPDEIRTGKAEMVMWLPGLSDDFTPNVAGTCEMLSSACQEALRRVNISTVDLVPDVCTGQIVGLPWTLSGVVNHDATVKPNATFPPLDSKWPFPALNSLVPVALSKVAFGNSDEHTVLRCGFHEDTMKKGTARHNAGAGLRWSASSLLTSILVWVLVV